MTRFAMPLALCALAGVVLCAPAGADDPPKKLTAEERKAREGEWARLNRAGLDADNANKPAEAEKAWTEALKVARTLYPKADFPDGHANLATGMFNLGDLLASEGKFAAAEPLLKDALAMRKAVLKGDHLDVAGVMDSLGRMYTAQFKLPAAEQLFKDAHAMRKRLIKGDAHVLAVGAGNLAGLYWHQGKYADAEPLFEEALAMSRRVAKGDHPNVSAALNNLAMLYRETGRNIDAEPLLREALAMDRRANPPDHPDTATALSNLAEVLERQGQSAEAEALSEEALAMRRRRFKGDHPDVATGLNNLAAVYAWRGKFADAEALAREALEMRRRLFKGDHPDVAGAMNTLAQAFLGREKLADAEALYKDALAMKRRLFKSPHPEIALSLNNLAQAYHLQGKLAEVEPLLREVAEMNAKLFPGDHEHAAVNLNNLGVLLHTLGKYADAEKSLTASVAMKRRLFRDDHADVARTLSNLGHLYASQRKHAEAGLALAETLGMYRRLTARYAKERPESETLTLVSRQAGAAQLYLSNARAAGAAPATAYPQQWFAKGFVGRAYERRHQQARAANDPAAAKLLAELTDARRRRAELLLAPAVGDPATRAKRQADVREYEARIVVLTKRVSERLPAVVRADRFADATPADLQKVLPADVAVVDYFDHLRYEQDAAKPGKAGEKRTRLYTAFVVTRDAVAWVDLGATEDTDLAVRAWRDAITGGKAIPDAIPAKVRELVWDKVRKAIPAGTKTVYVCPDADLCQLPFAALPGDKPGTILLDDFAVATIPHAPFLLDKLSPPDKPTSSPEGALVVGGVKYDAPPAPAAKGAAPQTGPLVRPDAKLVWKPLPGTAGEANGVAEAAARRKLPPTRLEGDAATPGAVLAALPKAKVALLATHGFFADASFRSAFQLDANDFQVVAGERVGRAVNSPLVMTGLVFAGANDPKTPGRGIITGEQLVDLDLSGLELAVLSACETGLGDTTGVAGGEGSFGLQRAFHYAGTTNVVCSLWKVPDQSTAALMGAFYRNLWDKNLPAVEALRQAQLELYRSTPAQIAKLAEGFRGKFDEVDAPKVEVKTADGKAHPLLWAAFTLSGPGR